MRSPITALTFAPTGTTTDRGETIVLAVRQIGDTAQIPTSRALTADQITELHTTFAALGIDGTTERIWRLPSPPGTGAPTITLVGLGTAPPTTDLLREVAGTAARHLTGVKTATFDLPTRDDRDAQAVAEGALLGAYTFTRYRTTASTPTAPPLAEVRVLVDEPDADILGPQAADRISTITAAVHRARDLVNRSPIDLFPQSFCDEAIRQTTDLAHVSVRVLDEHDLADGGYGGLLGVGGGSTRHPRLCRVDYTPPGAHQHLAIVGKGITFDSGGISIKPSPDMALMKSDMAGAAATLQTVIAAAELGLNVRVTGWLALAENMPSGSAQRPSDVITIRGGRTVEVLDTDAEGRLVLADGLVAAREDNPDVLIDVATLTGSQMVALGRRIGALMSNDQALRTQLERLGEQTGDALWPMPLPRHLRAGLTSPVADIANIGTHRWGGMLAAGLFLQEFIDDARDQTLPPVRWAHLDIAGPAYNDGDGYGYTPTGGTGSPIRALIALAGELTNPTATSADELATTTDGSDTDRTTPATAAGHG